MATIAESSQGENDISIVYDSGDNVGLTEVGVVNGNGFTLTTQGSDAGSFSGTGTREAGGTITLVFTGSSLSCTTVFTR